MLLSIKKTVDIEVMIPFLHSCPYSIYVTQCETDVLSSANMEYGVHLLPYKTLIFCITCILLWFALENILRCHKFLMLFSFQEDKKKICPCSALLFLNCEALLKDCVSVCQYVPYSCTLFFLEVMLRFQYESGNIYCLFYNGWDVIIFLFCGFIMLLIFFF